MQTIAIVIWGVVAGLIGLVGLFMAAGAHGGHFALAGYLFMAFGVVYVFHLINRYGPGSGGH